jgi:hypothetical protein
MFLPSEAVYAELHANFPEVVREGFDARVWIVSPTTCMATLNTMRAILKDARMREQAGAIRSGGQAGFGRRVTMSRAADGQCAGGQTGRPGPFRFRGANRTWTY